MKQTSSLVFASRKAAEVLRSCEGFTTRDFPNDLLRRETNNNDADDDDDEMKEFGQSDEGDHNGSASSLHDLLVEMSSSGHFETAWAIRDLEAELGVILCRRLRFITPIEQRRKQQESISMR